MPDKQMLGWTVATVVLSVLVGREIAHMRSALAVTDNCVLSAADLARGASVIARAGIIP